MCSQENKFEPHLVDESSNAVVCHPDGPWTVLPGILDDQSAMVRINLGVRNAISHPDYPFQVGVNILCNTKTVDGMPEFEELQELYKIEDALSEKLTAQNKCLHVGTLTTQNARELVCYTGSPSEVQPIILGVNRSWKFG